MKTTIAFDRAEFNQSKRFEHPAGYLIIKDCMLARSGILPYKKEQVYGGTDNSIISVYRTAAELKKSLQLFQDLPLTLDHPDSWAVTPETAKEHVVGHIGSNCRLVELAGGETGIQGDVTIVDRSTIDALLNGVKELSVGYRCKFKPAIGMTETNIPYQGVQEALTPNHVALVEDGRCGSECCVSDSLFITNNDKEPKIMKTTQVTLNGKTYAVNPKGLKELQKLGVVESMEEGSKDEVSNGSTFEINGENYTISTELAEQLASPIEKEIVVEESPIEIKKEKEIVVEESPIEIEKEKEKEKVVEESPIENYETDEMNEVTFEDGTIGYMDNIAYMKYNEILNKNGETQNAADGALQAVALVSKLSPLMEKVRGTKLSVDSYTSKEGFNFTKLKNDFIKAVLPDVTKIQSTGLDDMLQYAIDRASADTDVAQHTFDLNNLLGTSTIANDTSDGNTFIAEAHSKRRDRGQWQK